MATLRGTVRSYSEQVAAERAALRVFGTQAVANDFGHPPGILTEADFVKYVVGRNAPVRS